MTEDSAIKEPDDPIAGAIEDFLAAEGQQWWGQRPESVRRLIASAVVLFSSSGYHGTTTREIARRADMSSSGMYAHFAAKADLLYEIARAATASLLEDLRYTFSRPADPQERYASIVYTHVRWHAEHARVARMATYEMQFLPVEELRHMRALGRQFEEIIAEAIRLTQGADRQNAESVQMITRAIIAMGIDATRWYRPKGSMSPDTLASGYQRLALAMLPAV